MQIPWLNKFLSTESSRRRSMATDPGIAVVRRNTEEVQGRGNFEVFEELFAIDFVDHTPHPRLRGFCARCLRTYRCDREQRRRNATLETRRTQGRRMESNDRCEHSWRLTRNSRGV